MAQSRYFLVDDFDVSSTGAGGSGQPVSPEFYCNNDGDAALVAQSFAQLFQRRVRPVKAGSAIGSLAAKAPNLSLMALSFAPSSMSF